MDNKSFYEFVLANKGQMTWEEIGKHYNMSGESARCKWKRKRSKSNNSNWQAKSKWEVKTKEGKETLYSWKYTPVNETYFDDFLTELKELNVDKPNIFIESSDSKYCAVIGSTDLHLGNMGDLNKQIEYVKEIFYKTFNRLAIYAPEKVYLIVGSDNLDLDGYNNTTTRGTPRTPSANWHVIFKEAIKLYIEVISSLSEEVFVEVVVLPGNHDETLSLALGDVLEAYFTHNVNVHVNNRAEEPRKVVMYYDNLFAFAHGDKGKLRDLPIMIASRFPSQWGLSTTRYFFTGHLHHQYTQEIQGNQIVVLPSIAPEDTWHKEKGYLSNKIMQTWIFHRHDGCEAIFNVK